MPPADLYPLKTRQYTCASNRVLWGGPAASTHLATLHMTSGGRSGHTTKILIFRTKIFHCWTNNLRRLGGMQKKLSHQICKINVVFPFPVVDLLLMDALNYNLPSPPPSSPKKRHKWERALPLFLFSILLPKPNSTTITLTIKEGFPPSL